MPIATVPWEDSVLVQVIGCQKRPSLEHLQDLRAQDWNELQRRIDQTAVKVAMPTGLSGSIYRTVISTGLFDILATDEVSIKSRASIQHF
ncbi:hypothetical protein AAII07_58585 [Microvirga sp. 0TCS3.31]